MTLRRRLLRLGCRHGHVSTIYFRVLERESFGGPGGCAYRNECLECGCTFDHIDLHADGVDRAALGPDSELGEQLDELAEARLKFAPMDWTGG